MKTTLTNWLFKKRFFGWSNLRWLIKELVNMYSHKESFFSKKRIESGIAFVVLQYGMIFYLMKHLDMDMGSMSMWAGIEAVICGYALNKIEKSKVEDPKIDKEKLG